MPKQWFPFLYWVCKQDHWPSTHLTCMVHHRNTSFLVHHCQAILHQLFHSFSGFWILKTQAKFFRVPTSWVLFLCFVFFLLVVMPTDFRQCLQILCGFQKVHTFPAGLGLSAFQELPPVCFFFATNALRLLPFRSLIVLSIFCSTGFSRRFPRVPSLPIRVSAVCYESQSICFFFQFCPFVQVPLDFEQAASFLVCWHFCCLICLLSISTIVWVSIAIFYFPHRLATVFVCLSVLVVFVQDFGKTWQVCRSNSVPSTDLLSGFEIVEIFCQVLEGPPECRKKLMVSTMWRLSLSPRVQHVEAALACWQERNCVFEVLRLFCAKKSNEVHSKKGEKVGPKTGPELRPIFGAC